MRAGVLAVQPVADLQPRAEMQVVGDGSHIQFSSAAPSVSQARLKGTSSPKASVWITAPPVHRTESAAGHAGTVCVFLGGCHSGPPHRFSKLGGCHLSFEFAASAA